MQLVQLLLALTSLTSVGLGVGLVLALMSPSTSSSSSSVSPSDVLTVGINYGAGSAESKAVQFINEELLALYPDGSFQLMVNYSGFLLGKSGFDAAKDAGTLDAVIVNTQDIGSDDATVLSASQLLGGGVAGGGLGIDQTSMFLWQAFGTGVGVRDALYADKEYVGFISGLVGPETFGWCKEPFSTFEELQTRTFRVPPTIAGNIYVTLLGENAKQPTFAGFVNGLKNGEFDCFEWNSPFADFGQLSPFYDLKNSSYKHIYLESLHQNIMLQELIINKKRLAQLSTDRAHALRLATFKTTWRMFNERRSGNVAMMRNMTLELDGWKGIVFHSLPLDVVAQYKNTAKGLFEQTKTLLGPASFFSLALSALQTLSANLLPFVTYELQGQVNLIVA